MYIDESYLQNAIGSAKLAALCPTSDELAAVIAQAHAETETALQNAGYTGAVPHTTYATVAACPAAISLAAFGAFMELAYGRNDLELPAAYRAYAQKLDLIRTGRMEIPSVTKSVARAVGGVSFTESSSSVTVSDGSRPQIFNRKAFSDGGF